MSTFSGPKTGRLHAPAKKKDGDEMAKKKKKVSYVTLRLECRKQVVVTTFGTVDLKVPRPSRRRIRTCWTRQSPLAEFLHGSNCIEWGESTSRSLSDLIMRVEEIPDSEEAYRFRWNPETKAWEFERGDDASGVPLSITKPTTIGKDF